MIESGNTARDVPEPNYTDKILVFDPSPDFRMLTSIYLKRNFQNEVITIETVEEIFGVLAKGGLKVIIVDPGQSKILMGWLRHFLREYHPSVKLIIFSDYVDHEAEDIDETLLAVLRKPNIQAAMRMVKKTLDESI